MDYAKSILVIQYSFMCKNSFLFFTLFSAIWLMRVLFSTSLYLIASCAAKNGNIAHCNFPRKGRVGLAAGLDHFITL